MNLLKKWWFWVLVVILFFTILYFSFIGVMMHLFMRYGSEEFIQGEIDKANYCDVNEDCISLGAKCPFGCEIYVNEKEVAKIEEILRSYPDDCIYDCYLCQGIIECVNNKCVRNCGDGYFCGDGICFGDEDEVSCPEDCSDCLVDGAICYTENVQDQSCDSCCSETYYEIDPVCPENMECLTMYSEYLAKCGTKE
jgi:hypothetical protein